MREIFSAFSVHPVRTTYTIQKGDVQEDAAELLIHNLPATPRAAQRELF